MSELEFENEYEDEEEKEEFEIGYCTDDWSRNEDGSIHLNWVSIYSYDENDEECVDDLEADYYEEEGKIVFIADDEFLKDLDKMFGLEYLEEDLLYNLSENPPEEI